MGIVYYTMMLTMMTTSTIRRRWRVKKIRYICRRSIDYQFAFNWYYILDILVRRFVYRKIFSFSFYVGDDNCSSLGSSVILSCFFVLIILIVDRPSSYRSQFMYSNCRHFLSFFFSLSLVIFSYILFVFYCCWH